MKYGIYVDHCGDIATREPNGWIVCNEEVTTAARQWFHWSLEEGDDAAKRMKWEFCETE